MLRSKWWLLGRLALLPVGLLGVSSAAAAAACVDTTSSEPSAAIVAEDSCLAPIGGSQERAASTRVSWQEEKHAGATTARRTDFNFLGLTGEITTETQSGSGTKSYSYDAFGARVGLSTGGSSYTYGRNSHGDINLLLAETSGAAAATEQEVHGAPPY